MRELDRLLEELLVISPCCGHISPKASQRGEARRDSLCIEFVSLSEQMDTCTPAGKMVFTVLGAVAELERSLIVERVKAGLRNAKAKGKVLGRPKRVLDPK